jgi:uncharacterized phage protein (TIGR02218 family)
MVGFTSLDLELVIGDITYRPFTGFDPGAAQVSLGLDKTDSQTLAGFLDESGISDRELKAGVYRAAEVRRFLFNYLDLPLDFEPVATGSKFIELPRGNLAEFKSNNLGYEAKVKDELSKLDLLIGTNSSMTCRCHLGDDRCRVNLTPFTHSISVIQVINQRSFEIDNFFNDGYFDRGRLKFVTGNNSGVNRDIGFYSRGKILLYEPLPFNLTIGDQLIAVAGCLKTELACVVKFQNFANFQGEPDIPTTDLAINTPSG